ncbi:MAG: hypothetical protein HYT80_04615 [Euryarchaeota archaeon]|nr:hypothetical protein [Euryarchaeota archaeon]
MNGPMAGNVALVAANLLLMSTLLVVYGRMLRQLRAPLTFGLVAFAAILWIQNAIQLYFFATMMEYYAGGVEGLVLVQNALAALAGLFLLIVTLFPAGFLGRASAPSSSDKTR